MSVPNQPSRPTLTWANITPVQFIYALGKHQNEELCISMIPLYVLSTGEAQNGAWDYAGGSQLADVLQLAAESGCWPLTQLKYTGNISITPPIVSILSTPSGRLIDILNSINGKFYRGRRYLAIPANLLVEEEVIHTPMASYSGYGPPTKNNPQKPNPYLPLPQVHSPQTQVPVHLITTNKAKPFVQPQTNDRHAQVSFVTTKTVTKPAPSFFHYRILFGEQPPSPRRTLAELQPWGTMPGGIPADLTRICNGILIRVVLLTRPNREKNINPLSLTWSSPDHTKFSALRYSTSTRGPHECLKDRVNIPQELRSRHRLCMDHTQRLDIL